MLQVDEYIKTHSDKFISELDELCRFKSTYDRESELEKTAAWLLKKLQCLGAKTNVWVSPNGVPVIYGEITGTSDTVLLMYNYYDVVTEGDLDAWDTKPFEPVIQNGRFYARGADSNKGNLLARIHAVETLLQEGGGELPITIKFVFEGEEEMGSYYLPEYFDKHSDLLTADYGIWAGERKDSLGRPQISLGTKGFLFMEIEVTANRTEVHSSFAAIESNPAVQLVAALATMVDMDGKCKIEGFYDPIIPPSELEIGHLSKILLPGRKSMGKVSQVQKYLMEPTCTICALHAGSIEDGIQTVLPNKAIAKIEMRLVPEQRYHKIAEQVDSHLKEILHDAVKCKVLGAEDPCRTPLTSPLLQMTLDAAKDAELEDPIVLPNSSVSGLMYLIGDCLKAPAISFGVGDAQSNPHGPNESISIDDYFSGIRFVASLIQRLSKANNDL